VSADALRRIPSGPALLAAAFVVYFVLGISTALVRPPLRDEAWFANPAVSLANHGHTGSTLLEADSWVPNLAPDAQLTRIDRRTYWIMPGHTALQAVWYPIVGFGLVQMRMLSVVFGAVGLLALYLYAARLFDSPRIAGLSALLVAFDHRFVTMAGNGRMDIIAAAGAFVALAWYVGCRDRRLHLAIVGATAAVTAAVLTHPVAIAGVLTVAVLVWRLDRHRLRISHVAAGLAVVAGFAAVFAAYAFQDVEAFRDQLGSNSAGRLRDLVRPYQALRGGVSLLFGTFAFGGGVGIVGILIPVILTAGAIAMLVWRSERYRAASSIVAWQMLATALYLTFFESQKLHFYLVHITPLAHILMAALVISVLEHRSAVRRLVVGVAVAALLTIQLAPTALRFVRRSYAHVYMPAVAAVATAAGDERRIVGSPEFAFAFGFDRVRDDRRLSIARREPSAVVVVTEEDKNYWPWLPAAERQEMARELASRPLEFSNSDYSVYGPRR
jgi:hypothetical protein